jgi:glyoxylase-like metal-dependent hydrolase (beta-lactamase superfamily II)
MTTDTNIMRAGEQVRAVLHGEGRPPRVNAFFDEPTFTVSYVVSDPVTRQAAVIDCVWNFEHASGRTSFTSADAIIAHVEAERLTVAWILETHAHADHLSAAPYLQDKLGGKLAIGREIVTVQGVFGKIFNEGTEFARDGSQFDRLLDDGDTLMIGEIPLIAIHVPGHTPADMAYVVGDALFTGDTMFMPDYGSARCDFLCHDYKAPGRDDFAWETTILAERTANVHIHEGVDEDQFVAMRTTRDATLSMPKLILPALQVNIRAGHLPPPEENGVRYLKLPLDLL